jgi:hypothetical protein
MDKTIRFLEKLDCLGYKDNKELQALLLKYKLCKEYSKNEIKESLNKFYLENKHPEVLNHILSNSDIFNLKDDTFIRRKQLTKKMLVKLWNDEEIRNAKTCGLTAQEASDFLSKHRVNISKVMLQKRRIAGSQPRFIKLSNGRVRYLFRDLEDFINLVSLKIKETKSLHATT